MGETRLLLLRHAETAAPDRFHGAESDVGLGERGKTQAETVAALLASRHPAAIYCSMMRRARETAEPIARASGLDLLPIESLHERRMGSLSGVLREEGWAAYETAKQRWEAGDLDYTHEGGESYAEIRARVVPAVEAIAARDPGKTVVVVAHGVVIRVLLTSLLADLGPAHFSELGIDFVAINELVWDGRLWRAAMLNGIAR